MKWASDSFQAEAQALVVRSMFRSHCSAVTPKGGSVITASHGWTAWSDVIVQGCPKGGVWISTDRPRLCIRRLSRRISLAAQVDSRSPRATTARWTSGSAPAISAAAEIESLPESIASTSSGIPCETGWLKYRTRLSASCSRLTPRSAPFELNGRSITPTMISSSLDVTFGRDSPHVVLENRHARIALRLTPSIKTGSDGGLRSRRTSHHYSG